MEGKGRRRGMRGVPRTEEWSWWWLGFGGGTLEWGRVEKGHRLDDV